MSIADKFEVIADEVYSKGLTEGEAQGRQAACDEFWDTLQNNGALTNYTLMFANPNWTDNIFNPKHNFVSSTFYRCWYSADKITRIPKILDGSNASTVTGFNQAFYGMNNLVKIEKIISRKEAPWTNTFESCIRLAEVQFDGVVGRDIDLSDTKVLTAESMKSLINVLADYSIDNPHTYTVSFSSNCWTRLEADSAAPNGKTWKDYVYDVKGWNY